MNFIVLFSKDIIVFSCGMLSSIFVARHLGPQIYGSYIFVMLVFAYFENFGRFRTSISILPYLKNNTENEKTIFSLGFLLNGIMGVITIFSLVIIGQSFGLFTGFSNWVYLIISVMIMSESILVFTSYALVYQNKFKLLAAINTARPLIQTTGFALIFFFIQGQSIIPYLTVYALTGLLTALFAAYFVRNYINLSYRNYRELDLKLYFKTSLKFYLTDFVNFFSKKGVATFVAAKVSMANLAFFNIVFSHFDLLRFPNSALGTLMYPALSKESNKEKQRKYISKKILFNVIIYLPILILAYFLYPRLVLLFYGQEYRIVTQYFPYVLFLGAPYLIIYPIIHYFSSNGAPQYEGFIVLFSLLIQIISVLLFSYFDFFTLFNAIISQALGFIGFTFALLAVYKSKKLAIQ